MLQHHADDARGGGGEDTVIRIPGARAGGAPQAEADLLRGPRLAGADQHGPAVGGVRLRWRIRVRLQERERGAKHGRRPAARRVQQRGAGPRAAHVNHRRPLGAERVQQRVQRGGHHARSQHLLAHPPEDVVDHLAPAERRGNLCVPPVLLGHVQRDAARADDAALRVEQRGRGEGEAGGGAIRTLEPGPPPPQGRSGAERVEARAGVGQQQLGGLAEQGARGPAKRRVRCEEGEAAPDVGLEGEVGGHGHEVAPPLPALEQGAAQRIGRGIDRLAQGARQRGGDELGHAVPFPFRFRH